MVEGRRPRCEAETLSGLAESNRLFCFIDRLLAMSACKHHEGGRHPAGARGVEPRQTAFGVPLETISLLPCSMQRLVPGSNRSHSGDNRAATASRITRHLSLRRESNAVVVFRKRALGSAETKRDGVSGRSRTELQRSHRPFSLPNEYRHHSQGERIRTSVCSVPGRVRDHYATP
jgi:hypothetical protein